MLLKKLALHVTVKFASTAIPVVTARVRQLQFVVWVMNESFFNDGEPEENSSFKKQVIDAFDSFSQIKITRRLYVSFVDAVFSGAPSKLKLEDQKALFRLCKEKAEKGEKSLAALVGKEEVFCFLLFQNDVANSLFPLL